MTHDNLYDLSPLLRLALLAAAVAVGPLAWWWSRHRRDQPAARLHRLTLLTLFLTFDLVLFGAFTRLSDSGLGCPDWPGCYGSASPLGAEQRIASAQNALPGGPVSHAKAWVEMTHRYLASAVGLLIAVQAALGWWPRLRRPAPADPPGLKDPTSGAALRWWATATLVWVCVQGAFGALTVTMKLYPLVVTAHLMGGLWLLALLTVQTQIDRGLPFRLQPALQLGVAGVLLLALMQAALGGWVSTNYAVLACSDFPTCQGAWWPVMDATSGFRLGRALGAAGATAGPNVDEWLPFPALTAIHFAHRIGAAVLLSAMALLGWRLYALGLRLGADAPRRWGWAVFLMAAWQAGSGIGNVVLGWPLAAALAHTAGAAALIILLTALATRSWQTRRVLPRLVASVDLSSVRVAP